MEEIMLKIDNISKIYKLGQIGGTTLCDELQRLSAKLRHKEDPTKRIGAKDYNKGETFMALNGVSFEVKKGERVGIIGHNGAGKSTLLKLISRVTAPTGGTISMNGRVASMLEVGTGFHGELTGRENIYMNGAILGMTKKEIDAKIEEIIDFSECRQFIDTPVKRYSSGMYVKLAFSVAAHLDSEIMIMDEVLAVGDMAFQKKCLDKMNDVSRKDGRTILYVSHNMNTIRQLCDRVVVLNHGLVIFDGEVKKGIDYYFKSKFSQKTKIDYASIPTMKFITYPKIKTMSAEFIGKSNNAFFPTETLINRITWRNLEDIDSLSIRIEIHKPDGSAVASGMITNFYSGLKDSVTSRDYKLNIEALVPGQYSLIYTFSDLDRFGNEVVVDCVYGLDFEIKSGDNDIVWNSICWGNFRLPMMIVDTKE